MVFDLSSKGYNQNRISAILHVSQALVSLDLAQLRKDAANSMKSYLEEKLPLIYQECYEGISQVISRSWEMINDQNTPSQTRVALLGLVADAIQTKLDISCGGEIIESGIKYARQNINNRFVAIAKPEADEMLHPVVDNDDNNIEVEEEATTAEGNNNNNNDSSSADNNNNDNNIVDDDNDSSSSNVDVDDDDDKEVAATKEEDYTTDDPFSSSYSASFSSSSSPNTNDDDNSNNTEGINKGSSSNRKTKNSVF